MSKLERITDRKLARGWAASPGARVRAATAADIDAIGPLAELAGTPFEEELQAGICDGTAGAGLRVGLRDGPRAYTQYMAGRFAEHLGVDPARAYMFAALIMVAEQRDTGVVGALIAYPPVTVATQLLHRMDRAGYDEQERVKTMLGAGMFLTRIKTVAVAEPARGKNLGGSLLKRAKQVYDHCQYQVIYGAMPEERGLDGFYRRAGFSVHEPGTGLDLFLMFGRDTKIFPEPGERLFSRQRLGH